MEEYTNYLVHHGVKGQKWGVRRYQNADGSLTDKGKKKCIRTWNSILEIIFLKRQEK